MATKHLTNNSNSDFGLPNGVMLNKGATVKVEEYEKIESNVVLKAWIDAKAVTVSDSAPKTSGEDEKADEAPKAQPRK